MAEFFHCNLLLVVVRLQLPATSKLLETSCYQPRKNLIIVNNPTLAYTRLQHNFYKVSGQKMTFSTEEVLNALASQ